MRPTHILATAALAIALNAHAQDPLLDLRQQLERQRSESIARLRHAIIELRSARQASCRLKAGHDCLLAELSTAELALLNVEDYYRIAGNRASSNTKRENYKKIQELADDLRGKVDELADLIEKSEE
jgi:hypothetical protein